MTEHAVNVTDHCLLRYIERVKGVDLDKLRAEIAAIVGPAHAVGASVFSKDGFTYWMRGRGCVTTVTAGSSPQAARRDGSRLNGKSVRMQRGARA